MEIDLQSSARFLNLFNSYHYIPQGKQLHLLFLKKGVLNATVSIANRLLQMYMRCGQMADAEKLFDEMTERNSFTWNTLLEGYVKLGRYKDLLQRFYFMPNKNDFSWNVVISGLTKAGMLDIASRLFKEMPRKSAVALNVLIHGYVRSECPDVALRLLSEYSKWGRQDLCWDSFVLASCIGACADLGVLDHGKQIHNRIITGGVQIDSVLGSSLVNMYAKCGDLADSSHVFSSMEELDDFSLSALVSGYANSGRMEDARKVFNMKSNPSVESWNTLISGYVANDKVMEALLLFGKMRVEGVNVNGSTLTCILSVCSSLGVFMDCQQLHSYACKLGLIHDIIVSSALIDSYAKCGSPWDASSLFNELEVYDTILLNTLIAVYSNCGRIEDAKQIFKTMPCRNLISWNSMIVGLSQNGFPLESLDLFCEMNRMTLRTDEISLASVISACASISSIEFGEQLFARATIVGLDSHKIISSSLIDFYCKCGFVETGKKVFDQTTKFDVATWNSMLMGYATNGYGLEALDLFQEMRLSGLQPSDITFIGVLSACDHCGLLEEAQKWFHAMKHDYQINPDIEHYSCMVDLFSRAGCVEEALDLLEQMPFKADANIWTSVLRGCVAHGDRNLGKKVAGRVMELDPENSVAFVQLSNIFANSGDWKDSALIRKLMKDKKIEKNPGRSWGAI
ncbi:hypothetical protein M9H77_14181 [Catharanthus roseus]|uniref:Uncharacterized protein n=1 Tax=Catharanthus roseus TaxID=4058 RepID=A0ACC0BMH9_CATRO|nr:hypothetical protein M9H77_14181 [Catharanthus roseus]